MIPGAVTRRVAAIGLSVAGFALAAFTARFGDLPIADLAIGAVNAGFPESFARINIGLLLGGLVVTGIAALTDLFSNKRERRRAVLGVVAWVTGAWFALSGVSASRGGSDWAGYLLSGFLFLLALAALLGTLYLTRLDRAFIWIDLRLLAPPRRDFTPPGWPLLDVGLVLAGCLAFITLLLPWGVIAIAVATMALALAAHLLSWRRAGGTPVPVLPVIAIAIIPFAFLSLTISGPEGGSFSAMANAPFSLAAERLLGGLLLIVAAAFTGLWPFHGVVPGGWVAPAGTVLLLQLGVPAMPDGLIHWQPLIFPLLTVTVWHAAITRRLPALFSSLALMSAASVHDPGTAGAMWLLGGAFLFLLLNTIAERSRVEGAIRRLAWIVPGWGTFLAITAGLQAQVVYTVLVTVGLMAGFAWVWRPGGPPLQLPTACSHR